jgi:hypothetical protein
MSHIVGSGRIQSFCFLVESDVSYLFGTEFYDCRDVVVIVEVTASTFGLSQG